MINTLDNSSDIVVRDTIASIVQKRNETLALFQAAHAAVAASAQACSKALKNMFHVVTDFNYFDFGKLEKMGLEPKLLQRPQFMEEARKLIDSNAWSHVIEISTLTNYMDSEAKSQLRAQLMTDPPECTEDNIAATLQEMYLNSGMMFRRGVAQAFSSLDRRFLSHDGWKIGGRIVLSNALCYHGFGWAISSRSSAKDCLVDVERVFRSLAKMPPVDRTNDVGQRLADAMRSTKGHSSITSGYFEDDLFRIRWFKNRNVHVWFRDAELLFEVNKLISEYYGNPIPETRNKARDYQHVPKMGLVPGLAYFRTPDAVANQLVRGIRLWDGMTILEPSAGCGSLVKAVLREAVNNNAKVKIIAVEYDTDRANQLRLLGPNVHVIEADFLQLELNEHFDYVVMNPPFDRGADITHVLHARKFLRPGGKLRAIMSAGTVFRSDKNAMHFQDLVKFDREQQHCQAVRFHPFGAFRESGTNVNTIEVHL